MEPETRALDLWVPEKLYDERTIKERTRVQVNNIHRSDSTCDVKVRHGSNW